MYCVKPAFKQISPYLRDDSIFIDVFILPYTNEHLVLNVKQGKIAFFFFNKKGTKIST